MEQEQIDVAVAMATRAALLGTPVSSITWIPPQNAGDCPDGIFVVEDCDNLAASDVLPWETI